MIQDIKAIDIHSHLNHGSPFDQESSEAVRTDLDYLNLVRIGANIEETFTSTFASVINPEVIEEENEYLADLCSKTDYLYQWVVIDPRNNNTFIQASKMLSYKKCVGVKLHPGYHKYTFSDYGDKICSFLAEYDATVLIHPDGIATHILPYADKYANVTFIQAHLNGNTADHIDAIRFAKNKNVYTDTSSVASSRNRVIEHAVNEIGSEHILFGTDTYSTGFQRGRIEYALISEKDKENILRNNAVRLFHQYIKEV